MWFMRTNYFLTQGEVSIRNKWGDTDLKIFAALMMLGEGSSTQKIAQK